LALPWFPVESGFGSFVKGCPNAGGQYILLVRYVGTGGRGQLFKSPIADYFTLRMIDNALCYCSLSFHAVDETTTRGTSDAIWANKTVEMTPMNGPFHGLHHCGGATSTTYKQSVLTQPQQSIGRNAIDLRIRFLFIKYPQSPQAISVADLRDLKSQYQKKTIYRGLLSKKINCSCPKHDCAAEGPAGEDSNRSGRPDRAGGIYARNGSSG
jgi:hypothetical protein